MKRFLGVLEGLNVFGTSTIDPVSYSFDCLLLSSFNDDRAIWRLLFSLSVPLIVVSLLSFHWGYRSVTRHGGDRVYTLRRLALTVITVTYATYFDLTQVAMRTFNCIVVHTHVDPFSNATTRYWLGDTSIECFKHTHIVLIYIALAVLSLITVCFPITCFHTLNKHRSEVSNTRSWTYDTLGFLGAPFKEHFIYWECVTMIKKAMLSIVLVFSHSLGIRVQGLIVLLVLILFLYIHLICFPYDEAYHTLNYYESGSLLTSCVTYTMVQFFSEESSQIVQAIASIALTAVNVSFVGLMVFKIIRDLFQLQR